MRVILITGATSGVGFETAKVELPNVEFLQCDVSDYKALLKIAEKIESEYGKIDVLVNNAGTIIPGNVETLAVEDWDKVIKNNFSSYFYVSKAFLSLLKKGTNPNIVCISSISATAGGSSIAYSCAKAGVNMIAQTLSKDLAQYNIRVNTISPGIFNSGFQIHNNMMNEEQYKQMLEKQSVSYPFGIGSALDVANAIVFLASDKASWITGADLLIDGGKLASR